MHHEELESLVKNYPTIKRARFWMTFGKQYLTYLDCIQNLGMSRIDPITYEAPLADDPEKTVKVNIVPLQFLKAVLPNPQDLGENYDGETSIGCRIRGIKDGKEHTYYIYNNCKHQDAYNETGMQGVSYTTGVPAMTGAMMFLKGLWKKPGVQRRGVRSRSIPRAAQQAGTALARGVRQRPRAVNYKTKTETTRKWQKQINPRRKQHKRS
jgi:saccharopine dehydrogenase (NAD+, L-lysine-forming)